MDKFSESLRIRKFNLILGGQPGAKRFMRHSMVQLKSYKYSHFFARAAIVSGWGGGGGKYYISRH